jgi:hypothetical protein
MECLRDAWSLIKDKYWLFLGITAVGILIGSLGPMAILLGPMMCGIYLCMLARLRGEPVSFELLFKGFDYFSQSVIATLIQVLPVMVLVLPVYLIFFFLFMSKMKAAGGRSPRGAPPIDPSELFPIFIIFFVVLFALVLVASVIGVLFIFSYPLIVDRRLAALDAVKTSVRAVTANLGGMLGLLVLNLLLSFVGVLFCYVGAILTMPIGLAAWAVAYRRVFPAQS